MTSQTETEVRAHLDAYETLEASAVFFEKIALPSLQEAFPALWETLGAGLMGNGSECFGYDDELSRDHNWGVDFLLWPQEDANDALLGELAEWKMQLARTWQGLMRVPTDAYGVQETVMKVSQFSERLIGCKAAPTSLGEWARVPEEQFALCTNGRVFRDPSGQMTALREQLGEFYPRDLRLKRIAARCMAIAQTGQYNYERCGKRGDVVAMELALCRFCEEVIALVFLLNKRYRPYYKWSYRALCDLPLLADAIAPLLKQLVRPDGVAAAANAGDAAGGDMGCAVLDERDRRRIALMERICEILISELRRQGLSNAAGTFIATHGEAVQRRIEDPRLARIAPQTFI